MPAAVEYRTIIEGQRHFFCERLRATIDTANCADRWARALPKDIVAAKFITCLRCPLGWRHHGEHHPGQMPAAAQEQKSSVCVRCGRPSGRLVSGEVCLSCYNREAEWRRGYDARGNVPRNYRPITKRRVGVVGPDDVPSWALFEAQHTPEAMARACRAGLRLSDQQPGSTHWNVERQAFEYLDQAGRVLLEMQMGDRLEYVGVDRLHPGEQPAAVRMPTLLLSVEEAQGWLTVSNEAADLTGDPIMTEFACRRCKQGMLHASRRAGEIRVECAAGCS
jgi:hypothetical protein